VTYSIDRVLNAALVVFFTAVLMSPGTGLAVTPLVTDDAGTTDFGQLEVNGGWQLTRTGSMGLHTIDLNPVFGVSTWGEVGADFGYQFRSGDGDAPSQDDADSVTDLALTTKWRLWLEPEGGFELTARLDLKVPTASEHDGLGTGKTDAGARLIGTRCWGTCFDWNVGYTANDLTRTEFDDDLWFVGQAVRHDLPQRWTLIGESYALIPEGQGPTNVYFNGGAQYAVRHDLLVSVMLGSSVGRNGLDLLCYVGFSAFFF
jgi:hypothetical protein